VGRTPWSAADALVGHLRLKDTFLIDNGERVQGTRADQGVRPTICPDPY